MKVLKSYINTYSGLSKPAWMLALVLLINRSGSMVLPFLSIYLKDEMELGLEEVGIILTMFGVGSLIGSFLGGWLTDKIGTFRVQVWSLVLTGIGFFVLEQITTFEGLAIGFCLITIISDSFRPANAAAVAEYAKPENISRAYSLNRMAINLGFSVGPAIGGLLAAISFSWLFRVDGITCIFAAVVYALYFYPLRESRNIRAAKKVERKKLRSVYRDWRYLLIALLTTGFAMVFFQFLFTLPLYYREYYVLSEESIGWLLALNGFIVFLLEMPLVYILTKKSTIRLAVVWGMALLIASYFVLNLDMSIWILIIAMILLSISEIFVMPFLTTYTANRAGPNARGKYLGVHAMSYSVAFIAAPALGLFLVKETGYDNLWYFIGVLGIIVAFGFYFLIEPEARGYKEEA